MRLLFLGLNYAPEQIGIAVYSTGLCEALAARGHEVNAVVAKPHYPEWRIRPEFRGLATQTSRENGVSVTRVPLYVPANPTGAQRILHHISFAVSALIPTLRAVSRYKPDLVVTMAPSLAAAPVARLAASLAGVRAWLHIQDFEVDAAFATGLVAPDGVVARLARRFERFAIRRFDHVSSISLEMCRKAQAVLSPENTVFEFRNWAEIDEVKPLDRPSAYRQLWGITTPHVALYSGNIANKQGIEIILDAARLLSDRRDLTFVICGEGPNRAALQRRGEGLSNVQFHDLQPFDQLNELMGLATIHLLPQMANAADLVLPSKLANMLASGRPVIATARAGTGLAREVEGAGVVVEPDSPEAFAVAIARLLDEPALHTTLSAAARARAEAAWAKANIIAELERRLSKMAGKLARGSPVVLPEGSV